MVTKPKIGLSSLITPNYSNVQYKIANAIQTITYYDGLGKPKQIVQGGFSPTGKSVINHYEYEVNIGQVKNYLPYVDNFNPDTGKDVDMLTNINATNLDYIYYAKARGNSFYNTKKYEYTINPYQETVFEKSPLKRKLKVGEPGEDW
jgi:hypothetical protein